MQGPKFLYGVANKAGQTASFNGTSLEWNSVFTPLDLSPDGWMQLSILTERNKSTFGVDVTYGAPQNFVLSAASILKSIMYTYGINFPCWLVILEQRLVIDDTEYGFYYDLICKCEIDLSSAKDNGTVTANILDGDVTKYLKANGDVKYSIDIDVPERKGVVMDGTVLQESASFILVDPIDPTFAPNGNHVQGLQLIAQDQKSTLGSQTTDREVIDQTEHAKLLASTDYILQTSNETVLTVITDYAVTVQVTPGSGLPVLPGVLLQIGFIVLDAAGNAVAYPGNENVYFTSGPFPTGGAFFGRHIVKVTHSFTVPANCTVYPRCQANATNDSYAHGVQFIYDNNDRASDSTPNMILQYTFKFKATVCWGLLAPDLFKKLVSAMTAGNYTCQSSLLDNPDIQLLFTCGDALRQLRGSQIKISMNQFFKCINLVHGTGMGALNSILTIERKRFWVAPNDPGVFLGDAGNGYSLQPATDMLVSSIKIGWPKQDYSVALGDVNGKYEICVTHIYNTPNTRTSAVLDITTDVRGDMYGAEFARINLDGKTSVSDSGDNDVWALHVTKDTIQRRPPLNTLIPLNIDGVVYPITTHLLGLDRTINQFVVDNNVYVKAGDKYVIGGVQYTSTVSQYLSVGLIDKATAFNVALSPKQCLIRSHGDYIHSIHEKMENQYITFSLSDKNSGLLINWPGGVSTEENGDILIASLAAPIFKPWYFYFPISAPATLALDLASNPIRKYFTAYAGVPMHGTAMKTAVAPDDNAVQQYQLLLDPDVDLTPFITIYE